MSSAIEFDFKEKKCGKIEPKDAARSCERGLSCWIDLDTTDSREAEAVLRSFQVGDLAIKRALQGNDLSCHESYEHCLHVAATAVSVRGETLFRSRLDVILGEHFIITLHRGPMEAVDRVHEVYRRDFTKFAKSIGFILFEIFDHLTDGYRRAIRSLESDVEMFQARIFGKVDDEIFGHVGQATRNLQGFRSALIASRDLVRQLATRRSPFVSESTQPFLENVVGVLEGLSADLTVAREVLAESLDLYMSTVSHRTNRVVSRLTALSVIFLPLTFLCGVYGMNFRHQPELEWVYGYPAFWCVAISIAVGLLVFMKRRSWI